MPKLAIDIEARFAQAMDALDQLARRSDKSAKEMKDSFSGLDGLLKKVFSAAVIYQTASIAMAAAEFQGLAEQIGDTASAVASMRSAADISGVSLDTVAKASVRLTSTLAKGGEEAKNTATALSAMGIAFEDFKRLSPTDQLEQVALQLAKFEDGAGKTAVAVQLFGRAGAELIPFFNDLAAAGGKVADLTDEQILAVDEYTKSIARISSEFKKLVQDIASAVIPTFNTLISKYNELREKGNSVFGAMVGSAAPGLALSNIKESVNVLLAEQKRLVDGLENPPIIFGNSAKYVEQSRKRIKEISDEIAGLNKQREQLLGTPSNLLLPGGDDPMGGMRKKLNFSIPDKPAKGKTARETEAEKLQKWLDQQVQTAAKLNLLEQTAVKILDAKEKANNGITEKMEEQWLATARLVMANKDAEDAVKTRIKEEQEGFDRFLSHVLAVDRLADSYRDLANPADQYIRKLEEIATLQKRGALSDDDADKASRAIVDKMAGLEKTKEKITELDEFTRSAAQNMQTAFADFLFDPFKDGVDGMLKGFANTVRKMVAEAVAADLMKKLLGDYGSGGGMGGIVGAFLSGGGAGGSTNTTGTTLRAIEGGSDAIYGSAAPVGKAISISQSFNVSAGASKADMVRAAQAGKDQAVATILEMDGRR